MNSVRFISKLKETFKHGHGHSSIKLSRSIFPVNDSGKYDTSNERMWVLK